MPEDKTPREQAIINLVCMLVFRGTPLEESVIDDVCKNIVEEWLSTNRFVQLDPNQDLPKLKSVEGKDTMPEKFAFIEGAKAAQEQMLHQNWKKVMK